MGGNNDPAGSMQKKYIFPRYVFFWLHLDMYLVTLDLLFQETHPVNFFYRISKVLLNNKQFWPLGQLFLGSIVKLVMI